MVSKPAPVARAAEVGKVDAVTRSSEVGTQKLASRTGVDAYRM